MSLTLRSHRVWKASQTPSPPTSAPVTPSVSPPATLPTATRLANGVQARVGVVPVTISKADVATAKAYGLGRRRKTRRRSRKTRRSRK
uniref:Uncharacterized protein n=1 Tax=viral metagenome TaxID=1070528 RepID=A0A6C0AJQ5_9ZZZZ